MLLRSQITAIIAVIISAIIIKAVAVIKQGPDFSLYSLTVNL